MKVKVLEKNESMVRFILEESNPQFANALRRIALNEVPILAIDTVDFLYNDSVLYDEVLSHRLGLIPFVFDLKKFHFRGEKHEPEEDGCSLCEVILVIDKKGPCTVYSKDMKSSNPNVKPLYDDIPIVELEEGQKLKFEATAILGIGRKHAKHNASRTHYVYYPIVKQDGKVKNEDDVSKSCPKDALTLKNGKVSVDEKCDLCQECVKIAKPEGVLKIEGDPTKFIFTVETISGLNPEEIMFAAIDILKKRVREFEKQVKKL